MADPISWAVIAYTSVKGAFVMAASSAAFAMGASAATSLTVGAAAASAFKFAGITALSIAANALFSPSVGASGSPTEWRSDPNAGLPFVAGRLGVAGNLIYSKEFGADNRYLGNVTLYSRAGPVHSMGPFYADGVMITFGFGGAATNGGNIANSMWLSSQDGLQPQPTALPLPGALSSQTFTGWTANHKLSGCAADLQVLGQDSKFKTYPSGQPRRYRVIEGIKVYDPRLDSTFPGGDGACRLNDRSTYVYTTNAIIHALNWAIGYYENGKPVGGLADPAGPTLDGIDVEAFIAAANIADANAWTGLGARYSTADDKHQVLLGFLQAGGALYAENAGRISCVSRGAVKTSVMTLTRADTAGPVTVDAMPPRRVVINSLIPRCIQESYQWEPVDLEPVTVAAFVTADGGVRRRNKDFPFVTSSVQASQLAALDILDAREPLSGSTTFKPYVRDLKPGDAFTWDEPGFLLNGVKCVVMERSYDPASDTVEITWRSETDSKIAFALGLDPTPPVFPSVTPGNPSFVPVPSTDDWSATGGSIGNPGFVEGPVITLDGDPADLTDVTHILVDFRADGDTGWTHHGEFPLAGFEREQITGRLPNTSHDLRLRYRNAWGVIDDSAALIIEGVVTGDQVVASALEVINIDGRPAEEFADLLDQAIDSADLNAVTLLQEALDRFERVRETRDEAVNLFDVERTERIAADSAEATTRTTQISAVNNSIATVETQVTTVANNLAAETSTRTTQISAVNNSIAAVENQVDTVATNLAAETSTRETQVSSINGNISTINTSLSTLTTETSANATAITNLSATVTSQGNTLSSTVTTVGNVSATLEERTAAYVIAAQAGDGFAGVGFFARDDNETQTSNIRFGAGSIGFGPNFTSPRFVIDMANSEVFGLNAAGTVKTFQLGLDAARLRLRDASGTLTYDSDAGGVQAGALPPALSIQTAGNSATGVGVAGSTFVTIASATFPNGLPNAGVVEVTGNLNFVSSTGAARGEWRVVAVQGANLTVLGSGSWETVNDLASVWSVGVTLFGGAATPYSGDNVQIGVQANQTAGVADTTANTSFLAKRYGA